MHANKERGRPNCIVITKASDLESHPLSSPETLEGFTDLKLVLEQTSLSHLYNLSRDCWRTIPETTQAITRQGRLAAL